jgi:integrase
MGSVFNRGTRHKPNWYIKFRDLDGAWKMVPSKKPTKAQAETYLKVVESNISDGKAGVRQLSSEEVSQQRLTVKELGERFLKDYTSPRLKDAALYRKRVGYLFRKHLFPSSAGPLLASDRDKVRRELERLRDNMLAAKLSAQTAKLTLAHASKMYVWARKEGLVDCENPLVHVDKPSLAGRDSDFNFLTRDEVAKLLRWSSTNQPNEHPLYATAVFTGLRLGEAYGLRWTDVNLTSGLVTFRRSFRTTPKSGKARHVPLHPELAATLTAWQGGCRATPEGLVFPTKTGKMRNKDNDYGLKEALKKSGCRPVGFHELRHTFASHFIMAGNNILTLQKLLGHSSITVTMRYAHLAPDFMRQEVARMGYSSPGGADLVQERRDGEEGAAKT